MDCRRSWADWFCAGQVSYLRTWGTWEIQGTTGEMVEVDECCLSVAFEGPAPGEDVAN